MKGAVRKIISYLPEIVVLIVCTVLLLSDISLKKGYHMDELLSFELANAEFNPWIVPTQPQGRLSKFVDNELRGETVGETFSNLVGILQDILQNRGSSKLLSYRADVYEEPVWIDREKFVEYLTVDGKDAFNYLSVYFNVKDDNHPPLHFMVLHTISSVFQREFVPLMGCGINLVCVLGVMLLLMRLGRQLMALGGCEAGGRIAGLAAAAVYGLSAGAMSTTLLIRMYGMLTLWCVWLLAIHLEKLYPWNLGNPDCLEKSKNPGKPESLEQGGFERNNKLLIMVTVLGFLTQYFFLFYCLILAVITTVILLCQKRFRELAGYVRSMLTAAVIGLVLYPFAIGDVFSSGRGVEALDNLSAGFGGYGMRLLAFGQILAQRLGVKYLLVTAVVLIGCGGYRLARSIRGRVATEIVTEIGVVAIVLTLPVAGYFLLAARMSPYLVDRYIMPLFPLTILILVTMVMRGVWRMQPERETGKNSWPAIGLAMVLCVCAIWNNDRYKNSYLYVDYAEQEAVAEIYREYPCLCISRGVEYYWNLKEFTHYEKTLLLTMEELEGRKDLSSVSGQEKVVVLLKHKEDEEELRATLREKYGFDRAETLWQGQDTESDTVLLFGRQ